MLINDHNNHENNQSHDTGGPTSDPTSMAIVRHGDADAQRESHANSLIPVGRTDAVDTLSAVFEVLPPEASVESPKRKLIEGPVIDVETIKPSHALACRPDASLREVESGQPPVHDSGLRVVQGNEPLIDRAAEFLKVNAQFPTQLDRANYILNEEKIGTAGGLDVYVQTRRDGYSFVSFKDPTAKERFVINDQGERSKQLVNEEYAVLRLTKLREDQGLYKDGTISSGARAEAEALLGKLNGQALFDQNFRINGDQLLKLLNGPREVDLAYLGRNNGRIDAANLILLGAHLEKLIMNNVDVNNLNVTNASLQQSEWTGCRGAIFAQGANIEGLRAGNLSKSGAGKELQCDFSGSNFHGALTDSATHFGWSKMRDINLTGIHSKDGESWFGHSAYESSGIVSFSWNVGKYLGGAIYDKITLSNPMAMGWLKSEWVSKIAKLNDQRLNDPSVATIGDILKSLQESGKISISSISESGDVEPVVFGSDRTQNAKLLLATDVIISTRDDELRHLRMTAVREMGNKNNMDRGMKLQDVDNQGNPLLSRTEKGQEVKSTSQYYYNTDGLVRLASFLRKEAFVDEASFASARAA